MKKICFCSDCEQEFGSNNITPSFTITVGLHNPDLTIEEREERHARLLHLKEQQTVRKNNPGNGCANCKTKFCCCARFN